MRRAPVFWLSLLIVLTASCAWSAETQAPANRAASLQAICERLKIGAGAVVADVGCGTGQDTFVFAGIVGERGTVLAQEIDAGRLQKVVQTAAQKGLHQVVPVLGQSKDPHLPDGFVDLIYMNRVFHHFSDPQAMLRRMWADLKPNGFLVIVDEKRGPLTEWVPLEAREKKHYWTGETTVVRLARENGFLFHNVLNHCWFEDKPFVLAFRKPTGGVKPGGDPDLGRPLNVTRLLKSLPLDLPADASVLFCGLDGGREVLSALRERLPSTVRIYDVVLEEWAISREELPPGSGQSGIETLRTDKGRLNLPEGFRADLVVFVDAYHRLWDPVPILRELREHSSDSTRLVVVEREGMEKEARQVAGHHRRLAESLVRDDMEQAGFQLSRRLPAPARDRYFMLFEPKSASGE